MEHIVHFWGRLTEHNSLQVVFAIVTSFAEKHHARVARFDIDETELIRVRDPFTTYNGRVRGVTFLLEGQRDPVIIEFDDDLFMEQSCKTMGIQTTSHVALMKLLEEIEPCFEKLIVVSRAVPSFK